MLTWHFSFRSRSFKMIVVVIDRAQRNFVKLSTHTYSTYILLSRQTFLTCNYWNKEKYHQKSCVQVFSHGNTTMKIRKLWLNHSSSNLFSHSWKCLTIKWQTDSNCARALQLKKTLSKSPTQKKKSLYGGERFIYTTGIQEIWCTMLLLNLSFTYSECKQLR